jgi:hypothetical protein
MGDIFGDVFGPTLRGVEGDDPDRVLILSFEQVLDDGLNVGRL